MARLLRFHQAPGRPELPLRWPRRCSATHPATAWWLRVAAARPRVPLPLTGPFEGHLRAEGRPSLQQLSGRIAGG